MIADLILAFLSKTLTPDQVAGLLLSESGTVCVACGFRIVRDNATRFRVERQRKNIGKWNTICKREVTSNSLG